MQRRNINAVVCAVFIVLSVAVVAIALLRNDDSSSTDSTAHQFKNNNSSVLEHTSIIAYPWTLSGDSSNKTDDNDNDEEAIHHHDERISDFISITDIAIAGGIFVAPIISTTRSNKCTDSNKSLIRFTLVTDNYPWETSWKIIKITNNSTSNKIIAFGPPTGSNYERKTRYIGQFCLQYGNYKLRMKDRNNDGLCCQYGQGSYSVTLNGENIITSDDSNFLVKDYPFTAKQQQVKTIYIVRYAEKGTDCSTGTCIEGLSSKGNERANQLANWMMNNGIVNKVTHVFATHKQRTYLTVLPVAEFANVNIQRYPSGSDDNNEVDKLEEEASICPTVQAIKSTSLGSTIVMSTHRSAIYGILSNGYDNEEDGCTGLGLDTSNSANFPKDDEGKLDSGYSDLWKITIDANGKSSLDERLILDFDLDR